MLLCRVLSAAEEQWAVSSRGVDVPFSSWQAEGAGAGTGVLVLVLPTDIWQSNRPGKPGPSHQPTWADQAIGPNRNTEALRSQRFPRR